jgi:hypothetical protein
LAREYGMQSLAQRWAIHLLPNDGL